MLRRLCLISTAAPVLITGAAGGLGLAFAEAFAATGANLVL
jgi:NAD(P)-dependent dehydrogenase (short-subunit alcohol dehydrogenase family)